MVKMTSNRNKRRSLPAMTASIAMVVGLTATTTTRMSAVAFTAVGTTRSFSSTYTRPRAHLSTKLFAKDDSAQEEKLTFETITDDNSYTLLHPPSAPERPVLVDAFAPWCGPCKLLDKVLRKAQPRYLNKVDFCRWNVNDKENTVELKKMFLDSGFTITKLPSLIVFRGGKAVAVRDGFANEFQLDYFLEETLPELEKTFDEDGIKMVEMPLPLPEEKMMHKEEGKKAKIEKEILVTVEAAMAPLASTATVTVQQVVQQAIDGEHQEISNIDDCIDEEECFERLDQTVWQNRIVVPAMDGIMLPARSYGSP